MHVHCSFLFHHSWLLRNGCRWLCGALLLAGVNAQAAMLLPVDDGYKAQREAFEALEKDLQTTPTSRLASLNDEMEALQSYPLYPYLVRQRLYRDLTIRNRDAVESFLSAYDGRPFVYRLRAQWLRYLAKNGHKSAFLASYREGMGAEITCQYLSYQVEEANNPGYWLEKVDDIWLSGYSQPDACNPIFKLWQKHGFMTPDKVLARMEQAATKGDPKLIPYLQRQLPRSQQYIGDLWQKVRTAPRNVLRQSNFPLKNKDVESRILAHGIEKLAWQRSLDGVKAYYLWQPKVTFSEKQLTDMHRAIALSLAIDKEPDALVWLQRADVDGADEDVKRWHMAYLLRQQNWQQVLALIENAPPQRQQEDNFRYWRARTYEAMALPELAQPVFESLAGERHYYGFMASAKLDKVPNLKHSPTPRDQRAIQRIQALPPAQRAYEFLQLGRLIDARREWRYMLSQLDSARVKDAAILASEWGWYDQAIISFSQSGYMDDVERRFPLAFAPQFANIGQTYNIPPAFAMAIARRESSFMVDAVSPAGATGLMQLMPGTAQYLVDKRLSRNSLFEPDQNLQLGNQYLRYLMDKLDNNPVLVSASYNAGWRKVMDWLPEDANLATDVWIENIPYRETRLYVKAVLAYRYIYEQQLGTPSELFNQLATMAIPSAGNFTEAPITGRLQLAPE